MNRQSKSEEQGWPGFELHQENTKDKQQKKRPKVESEGEQKGRRKKRKQSRKQGFLGHSGGQGLPMQEETEAEQALSFEHTKYFPPPRRGSNPTAHIISTAYIFS